MDFIRIYDGFFTEKECSHLINLIDNGKQEPGIVASADALHDNRPDVKVSLDVNFSEQYPYITKEIIEKIQSLLTTYTNDVGNCPPIASCESLYGRKYEEGVGFYKGHSDAGNLRTITRVITVLMYLNTVEEGGELLLPLQDKIIIPAPGRVVMFPSAWTHPHIANMPLKGDRYILRTFIRAD